ncbi:hypothetical protein HCG51_06375 [Tolypothrix sp. PCC 7910]|uniref:hypothetical protein n=1 Tax=Tolypothrix sp. PCC 7910 TaxID=2099387 RepID=UPI0014278F4E|nr:hypothetical protein [Tolypothrix sp. PCC 7910]QIR36419.1 hypothetical protein HCG51_06375 [Tolypothrix sp. PCC 7910]
MVSTLEKASTSVKSTYTPPNPKPLLPDLDPQKTTTETEETPPTAEPEETTPPSESEEATQST